jgi:glycosyltransferase involved in cell wall biosynthesis
MVRFLKRIICLMKKKKQKKICFVTTVSANLYLFHEHLFDLLNKKEWHVTGLANNTEAGMLSAEESLKMLIKKNVHYVKIPIGREINPIADFICLIRLWWFFLWNRFDIVQFSTPKAILLGSIASCLTFQHCRMIAFHGRAYENTSGIKRKIFIWLDWLCCKLSHYVFVASNSLKNAMIHDKIGTQKSLIVLGRGNLLGCNIERFSKNRVLPEERYHLKQSLSIGDHEHVLLFIGRIRYDKGINELVKAFVSIGDTIPDWHLVLVGGIELSKKLEQIVSTEIKFHPKIHLTGMVTDSVPYYAIADILVLPSWREGFTTVAVEAASMEIPVIGSNAVGVVDAVCHEKTGLIVPVKDQNALVSAINLLCHNEELRKRYGLNGRQWVVENFNASVVAGKYFDFYNSMSEEKK